MESLGSFNALGPALIRRAIEAVERDERLLGLMLGGSVAHGVADAFSDLDFVVVVNEADHEAVLQERRAFAGELGPLVACFTGEHVNEPRLLICLFGPPLLHVDLKFVTLGDLASRVEDALVLWERDSSLLAGAMHGTAPAWPRLELQWIEDRFWVWIHYGASKLGRGELFEVLDGLAFLRRIVFGPLLAIEQGGRPQGSRRVEQGADELLVELEATVGDHTRRGCAEALGASVRLYRTLRERADDGRLVRRAEAERLSVAFLDALGEAPELAE